MSFHNNPSKHQEQRRSTKNRHRAMRSALRLETLESRKVFAGLVPIAMNDIYEMDGNTTMNAAEVSILSNDNIVDGQTIRAVEFAGPKHGTLSLHDDGTFEYTPNEGFVGIDGFMYQVDDGSAPSNLAAVTIEVNQPNRIPVGQNDLYQIEEDSPLVVAADQGVLQNDRDEDGDALAAELFDLPQHGTVQLNPDGSFSYTPDPDFNGTDAFTYLISDGEASSELVAVELSVMAVNDSPVGQPDNLLTTEDSQVNFSVADLMVNDIDSDGDSLFFEMVDAPQHGTLVSNQDGTFTYSPEVNFHGEDSFTYRVNDGLATSELIAVSISVTAVNDVPVASNDQYVLNEDEILTIDAGEVLLNDTDVDGDTLAVELFDLPQHGMVTINPDGGFQYVPEPDFSGVDSFTYFVSDGTANSELAVVEIEIVAVNDAPVAMDDSYQGLQDSPIVVDAPANGAGLLSNDSDVEGSALTARLDKAPEHGTVEVMSDGSFVYTPDSGFSGHDQFAYRVSDGAESSVAFVSLDVVAIPTVPVANNESYQATAGAALSVSSAAGVLANEDHTDGDLQVVLFREPSHGTLDMNADGSFTYTPDADYSGLDSFLYRTAKGDLLSPLAVTTVHVAPAIVEATPSGDGEAATDIATGSDPTAEVTSLDTCASSQTQTRSARLHTAGHHRHGRHHHGAHPFGLTASAVDELFASLRPQDLVVIDLRFLF